MTIRLPAGLEQFSREWYSSLYSPRPLLVVMSGPSGVGKDATIQHMKERGYSCHFVVTATTRPRRIWRNRRRGLPLCLRGHVHRLDRAR